MFPGIVICRHFQVEWLDSACCRCEGCGKIGHWSNEMVIWQRPPRFPHAVSVTGRTPDAETSPESLRLDSGAAKLAS
ncbi:MAG: hypothetical protein P8N76_18740 [Pirellulaceae bacterium]|nr:hypothetical protein [Pirellulaceae bacterium]